MQANIHQSMQMQPSVKISPKLNFWKILVAIIVLLLLLPILMGVIVFRNLKQSKDALQIARHKNEQLQNLQFIAQQQGETLTPIITPAKDILTDLKTNNDQSDSTETNDVLQERSIISAEEWQLYENDEHMFSVEYPLSWELVEEINKQVVVGFRKNPPNNPDQYKYTDIFFRVIANPENLSLENFYKNRSETSEMALPNPFKMGAKYLEVDGKRAAKITVPGAVFTEEVAVDLSGKILVIARYLDGNGKSIDKETEQVFNQMIGLIKFTQ